MIGHLYQEVFPARAGMIRHRRPRHRLAPRIPRESGDDPQSGPDSKSRPEYSPRERG